MWILWKREDLQMIAVFYQLPWRVAKAGPFWFRSVPANFNPLRMGRKPRKSRFPMKPSLSKQVSERIRVRELTDSLDPVSRVPGGFNPVDQETGRPGRPYELEDGSIWQKRKETLGRAEKLWPVEKEQDLVLEKVAEELSAKIIQELRKKRVIQASPNGMVRPKWKQSKRNSRAKEAGYENYNDNTSTPRWRTTDDQKEGTPLQEGGQIATSA